MIAALYVVLGLQGAVMSVDEFYYHRQRGLGRWERWGHPLDTLIFFFALAILWWRGPGVLSIVIATLSTLIITKDEWVHAKVSPGGEQWLHSLLFILHPLILVFAHFSWPHWSPWILAVVGFFLLYQTLYWNIYAQRIVTN